MLPVLQMCDGDIALDMDANQSFYGESSFVDGDLKKPGYEGLLVQEEVTIDGTTSQEEGSPQGSPLRSDSPSQTQVIMEPQGQQHDSDCFSNSTNDNLVIEEQVLDDQIVEIELDKEADELINSELNDNDTTEKVYTEMEPVQQGEFTTLLMEEDDSGIGSSGQVSPASATSYPSLSVEDSESTDLMSWTTKHPDNWSNNEVLDWIYSLADQPNTNIDSTQLRGEVSYITIGLLSVGLT